jgi:hypothetical protein
MTTITLMGSKKLDIKQLKPPFPAKQLQWRSTSGTVFAYLLTLSFLMNDADYIRC